MIAKHITVKGKVQGVFFRKYTKQKAQELNIAGWVKNTDEGDVEIMAQGNADALEKLMHWCKEGPPKAEVETVEVKDIEPQTDIRGFSIAYD